MPLGKARPSGSSGPGEAHRREEHSPREKPTDVANCECYPKSSSHRLASYRAPGRTCHSKCLVPLNKASFYDLRALSFLPLPCTLEHSTPYTSC